MATPIVIYNTRAQVQPSILDPLQFEADIRFAIARFSNSERRLPAAIVIPLQVARNLDIPITPLVGELYSCGLFDTIPLVAREAFLDPLFQLI